MFTSVSLPNASVPKPANSLPSNVLEHARQVLDTEIAGLVHVRQRLDDAFIQAVDLLQHTQGRIVVTGMGKSGLVGRKLSATLSSTGSPAVFLHPAEGTHGDVGVLMTNDVVLAISYSGETPELLAILPAIRRMDIPVVAMTSQSQSTLARQAAIVLDITVPQEACPMNLAPTASTTATMALGDALAVALLTVKGFTEKDFAQVHPAGTLGKRLLYRVADVMQTDNLPLVTPDMPFMEMLLTMSDKRLGLALVTDPQTGQLLGLVTDGDVRRALQHNPDGLENISITRIMTTHPKTITAQTMAVEALAQMETARITALIITNTEGCPVGVCHLHALLQAGIQL
jgi:arabinose-5-phosphate isomerase